MGDEDPGWAVGWGALWMLLPRFGIQKLGKRVEENQLTTLAMLRQVFVGFGIMLGVLSAGLAAVVLSADETEVVGPVWIAVLVVGVLAPVGFRLLEKPLDCRTDATLAATYRTRFFLRMGGANTAGLTGFVIAISTATLWPYAVCLAVTAVACARAAPSAAGLAREQDVLAVRGCARSLSHALALTQPSVIPRVAASGNVPPP